MRASDAIARADRLRPNTHANEDKMHWLQSAENHVAQHMNLHTGYDVKPDTEKGLLLDGADGEIYVLYLVCMYDYYNGDFDQYNSGALQYNQALSEWRARFRREHMPKPFTGRRNMV